MATSQQSVPTLIVDALRNTQDLLAKEIALFRAETKGGLRTLALSLSLFVVAGIFAITGLMVLLLALVKWLATLLGSDVLAALIVGGGFALVAIVLAVWGRSKMALKNLEPKRTEQEVSRDMAAIKEHVSR